MKAHPTLKNQFEMQDTESKHELSEEGVEEAVVEELTVICSDEKRTCKKRKSQTNCPLASSSSSSSSPSSFLSAPASWFHLLNVSKNEEKIRLPRIVKGDIRTAYPQMLLNVFNSMDVNLMTCFFEEHTNADKIRFKKEIVCPKDPTISLQNITFYGMKEIIMYLQIVNLISPDHVLRILHDPKIITRSNTYRTEIQIDYSAVGHRVKDTDVFQAACAIQRLRVDSANAYENYLTLPELEETISQLFATFEEPKAYELYGRFLLTINNIYDREEIDEIVMQCYGYVDNNLSHHHE